MTYHFEPIIHYTRSSNVNDIRFHIAQASHLNNSTGPKTLLLMKLTLHYNVNDQGHKVKIL